VDITDDYALSGALLGAPTSEFERLLSRFGLLREDVGALMETRPDTMRALFGRIRKAYGDVHCLLSDAGGSDDVTDRLRAAVLHAS
jgi:Tyrosine phosphatase family